MEDLEAKLIRDNWVTAQQINLAKQEASKCGKSIWAGLVRMGYLSLEDVAMFFAQETGIPYVRISDYEISPEIIRLVDENFCRQNLCLPLFKIKNTLFVACANPLDTTVVDSLATLTGCEIELLITNAHSITKACDYYYGLEDKVFELERYIIKQTPMQGLSFWREYERLALNIPVSLKVEDKSVVLHYSSPIEGWTCNISHGGTSVGLQVFLFLPKGIKLSLEFKPGQGLSSEPIQIIKAKGEVVYCRMEKGQRYFLGIKFIEIEDESRNQLLELVGSR